MTQLKSIRWAIKYGVSKYTSSSFCVLAMVLLNTVGEVETAILYGKLEHWAVAFRVFLLG